MNNNLFTSSVIALSLLLNFPITKWRYAIASQAQSNSTCQNTLDQVKKEIIKKGAKKAFIETGVGNGNDKRNPTNRKDGIMITPWPSAGDNINNGFSENSYKRIENILNSPVLMNSWANMIVRDCNNIAVITFCIPQSDCVASFAASPEGKAIYRRQASNCNNYDNISWYEGCYN